MKPYFETENGKLYHSDCLEIMPELEPVDLVLTDPQYGIGVGDVKGVVGDVKGVVGGASIVQPTVYGEATWDKQRPTKEYFDVMLKIPR